MNCKYEKVKRLNDKDIYYCTHPKCKFDEGGEISCDEVLNMCIRCIYLLDEENGWW